MRTLLCVASLRHRAEAAYAAANYPAGSKVRRMVAANFRMHAWYTIAVASIAITAAAIKDTWHRYTRRR